MKEIPDMKGYFDVDIWLTHLFEQLYGENEYFTFKDSSTLPNYKKQFSKLIITIQKAFIESCVETDNYHIEQINSLVQEQIIEIKNKKNVEELYQSLVVFFPKLCFLFIGNLPNNISKDKIDNRNNWNVGNFRKLHYSQSKRQKHELLFELLKEKKIKHLGSYRDELDKFNGTKGKKENFIDWFSRTYPKIYLNIFDRAE